MLVLSVALPIYERADLVVSHAFESQHQHGSCPSPHDHSICTQARANFPAPSHAPAEQGVVVHVRLPATRSSTPTLRVVRRRSRARAPPVVWRTPTRGGPRASASYVRRIQKRS